MRFSCRPPAARPLRVRKLRVRKSPPLGAHPEQQAGRAVVGQEHRHGPGAARIDQGGVLPAGAAEGRHGVELRRLHVEGVHQALGGFLPGEGDVVLTASGGTEAAGLGDQIAVGIEAALVGQATGQDPQLVAVAGIVVDGPIDDATADAGTEQLLPIAEFGKGVAVAAAAAQLVVGEQGAGAVAVVEDTLAIEDAGLKARLSGSTPTCWSLRKVSLPSAPRR